MDYTSTTSLSAALRNVDVVISTLSGGGWAYQPALADAAKEAGVGLFVPSEFGLQTTAVSESSMLWGKRALHLKLNEIKLPYVLFWTGMFSAWIGAFST